MEKIARRMRQRRLNRQFNLALENASPSMQHELIAAAARSGWHSR